MALRAPDGANDKENKLDNHSRSLYKMLQSPQKGNHSWSGVSLAAIHPRLMPLKCLG